MKQVKKRSHFVRILTDACVSISDLKRNPAGVFAAAEGCTLLVLSHNRPAAYVFPTETWERVVDFLQELKGIEGLSERVAELGVL
jgi:antitoxin StbD